MSQVLFKNAQRAIRNNDPREKAIRRAARHAKQAWQRGLYSYKRITDSGLKIPNGLKHVPEAGATLRFINVCRIEVVSGSFVRSVRPRDPNLPTWIAVLVLGDVICVPAQLCESVTE